MVTNLGADHLVNFIVETFYSVVFLSYLVYIDFMICSSYCFIISPHEFGVLSILDSYWLSLCLPDENVAFIIVFCRFSSCQGNHSSRLSIAAITGYAPHHCLALQQCSIRVWQFTMLSEHKRREPCSDIIDSTLPAWRRKSHSPSKVFTAIQEHSLMWLLRHLRNAILCCCNWSDRSQGQWRWTRWGCLATHRAIRY